MRLVSKPNVLAAVILLAALAGGRAVAAPRDVTKPAPAGKATAPGKQGAKEPALTNLPPVALDAPIPQSVFTVPQNSKQGRNPFFPTSMAKAVTTHKTKEPLAVESLILNGITSPPRRTAMINGRTFEAGESGDVKLPNGSRVPLQCVEIRDDLVVVLVAGQKRELRLRSGI
jgi:hypothetical protein